MPNWIGVRGVDAFGRDANGMTGPEFETYARLRNGGVVSSPEEFRAMDPFVRAHARTQDAYVLVLTRTAEGARFREFPMDLSTREGIAAWRMFLETGYVTGPVAGVLAGGNDVPGAPVGTLPRPQPEQDTASLEEARRSFADLAGRAAAHVARQATGPISEDVLAAAEAEMTEQIAQAITTLKRSGAYQSPKDLNVLTVGRLVSDGLNALETLKLDIREGRGGSPSTYRRSVSKNVRRFRLWEAMVNSSDPTPDQRDQIQRIEQVRSRLSYLSRRSP